MDLLQVVLLLQLHVVFIVYYVDVVKTMIEDDKNKNLKKYIFYDLLNYLINFILDN